MPVEQINTIGNIIASCINSTGGVSGDNTPCGTLFSLTTPTGVTPATNTATALLHLANDPTLNTASLYNLVTPGAPFQPSQPQVPADLSVRLTYPSGFTASTSRAGLSSNPSHRRFGSWIGPANRHLHQQHRSASRAQTSRAFLPSPQFQEPTPTIFASHSSLQPELSNPCTSWRNL